MAEGKTLSLINVTAKLAERGLHVNHRTIYTLAISAMLPGVRQLPNGRWVGDDARLDDMAAAVVALRPMAAA